MSALRDAVGHDLLWNGDPAVWNGLVPVLFAIVGALAGDSYRGQTYRLRRHGSARGKPFQVLVHQPGCALLSRPMTRRWRSIPSPSSSK